MKYKLVDFKTIDDSRGKLACFEKNINCPFEVKRVFFMYNSSPNALRGSHANKRSEFLLIAISGNCTVTVFDGIHENAFILDSPNIGLYIDKMVWKEISNFSSNSVILALSNEKYDANEYIKDKREFQNVL